MTKPVDHQSPSWRKSSFSGATACVEMAELHDGSIAIRNSRRPEDGATRFTRAEIDAFIRGVVAGEFDDLR